MKFLWGNVTPQLWHNRSKISVSREWNDMTSNIDDMTNTMLQNLESKTGKNLDEWIKIANNSPATKHKEIIDYFYKPNMG